MGNHPRWQPESCHQRARNVVAVELTDSDRLPVLLAAVKANLGH